MPLKHFFSFGTWLIYEAPNEWKEMRKNNIRAKFNAIKPQTTVIEDTIWRRDTIPNNYYKQPRTIC